MSDDDRSGIDRARLKQWLFSAIGAALAVIAIVSIQQWIYYDNAATRAGNDARQTENQISAECGAVVSYAECLREIEQASRAEQRDEYDLYSQQAMALWTSVVGAMAVLGIALSGVGIYLIWQTWAATREAAENSRNTLDSYIHRERAILRFGHAHFQFLSDLPIPAGFQVNIMNFGSSPGEFDSVSWEYLDGPIWPEKLRYEQWVTNISTPDGEAATPHLGVESIPSDRPIWLAVALRYRTLGSRDFESFAAYRIGYDPPDAYGAGGYFALHERIADQPRDT